MPDLSLVGVGTVITAIGAYALYRDARAMKEHREFCARSTITEGVVNRVSERALHFSRNQPTDGEAGHHVPVVRFKAANGVEYDVDAPDAPNEIGARVKVAYDPKLPSGGRGVDKTRKLGCTLPLLAIGIVLIIFAMFQS